MKVIRSDFTDVKFPYHAIYIFVTNIMQLLASLKWRLKWHLQPELFSELTLHIKPTYIIKNKNFRGW